MASVYLSASTQFDNQGVGNYGNEGNRMHELADKVEYYLERGNGNLVIYRNTREMTLKQSVSDSNSKLPDIHVALHTNAGGGKGTEIWCSGSEKGVKLATLIYNGVAPHTLNPDRGIKVNTNYIEVGGVIAISCILELMFHDNLEDVNDYLSKIDTFARSIAMSIYAYFGLTYAETKTYYRVVTNTYSIYQNAVNEVGELKKKGVNSFIIPYVK